MHHLYSVLDVVGNIIFIVYVCRNSEGKEHGSEIPSMKSTVKKKKKKKKSQKKNPAVSEKELKLGGQVEVDARGKVQFAVVRYVGPTHFLQGACSHVVI